MGVLAFVRVPVSHQREKQRWSKTCTSGPRSRSIPSASETHENLPKVWVCTSATCKGNSLLSTMRALVSTVGVSIEPTGCLGECGNGPNVATKRRDSVHISIAKHIDSLEQAVRLLQRLDLDISDDMLHVAEEKEKGDMHMLKGTIACAGEHYEKAIGLLTLAKSSSSASAEQYRIAILCNWAQSLVKSSDHEKALCLVNEVIEAQADCTAAWKWKALAHEGKREFDMARKCWEIWGKLSGKKDEAEERINRFTGWRAWFS